jgi:GDPmannose 4,6-dehydratase
VRNYREAYGMFACNGILFNHESPRRGETFVTKKVTKAAAARHHGNTAVLTLGNLDARRDWGHAKDYVEGMWAILQQDVPDDFVLATGQTHTIRNLCEIAYNEIGCNISWEGEGLEENGIDRKSGDVVIAIDSRYFRPVEVDVLCGDASKAKRVLGWEPRITFEELIQTMVRYDIRFDNYGGEEE